jgi:hypothetical protein
MTLHHVQVGRPPVWVTALPTARVPARFHTYDAHGNRVEILTAA